MRDDEGCQGNPPCQPASAYFSPLALAINTASPGELPDQTHPLPSSSAPHRRPRSPRRPPRPSVPLPRANPSSASLLLLTCLSTCALPSTVTSQPPPSPRVPLFASPCHLAIPFSVYLRLCVFLRCSLSLPPSLPLIPSPSPLLCPFPATVMNLPRKFRFMQRCVHLRRF